MAGWERLRRTWLAADVLPRPNAVADIAAEGGRVVQRWAGPRRCRGGTKQDRFALSALRDNGVGGWRRVVILRGGHPLSVSLLISRKASPSVANV